MYLTARINFKRPNSFQVTIDQILHFKIKYKSLEEIYSKIIEDKNHYLKNNNGHLCLTFENDFKYIYYFKNPHGDNIELIPDNKLSTKQLLFLYEFNIENNSQIVIKCQDNESEEQQLSKRFEALKRQVATTNVQIVDLYYSNIL